MYAFGGPDPTWIESGSVAAVTPAEREYVCLLAGWFLADPGVVRKCVLSGDRSRYQCQIRVFSGLFIRFCGNQRSFWTNPKRTVPIF